MGGALCLLVGSSAGGGGGGLGYSGIVTVGTQLDAGKGFAIVQHGFSLATWSITGTPFGSRSPTAAGGFTINAIYWETNSLSSTQTTVLVLNGNASAAALAMTVGGVNQNLGAGVFSGGVTTFTSPNGQGNPFGADGTMSAVVM